MLDIFNQLAAICKPENVIVGSDFIEMDFNINKDEIYTGNLTPDQINVINSVERIESRSQFLHGFNGRKLVFECYASYWNDSEVKEHKQYWKDKNRHKAHWEIDTNGFYTI